MKGIHVETIDRVYESAEIDMMAASDDYWRGYFQAVQERPIRWGPSSLDIVIFIAGVVFGVAVTGGIFWGW